MKTHDSPSKAAPILRATLTVLLAGAFAFCAQAQTTINHQPSTINPADDPAAELASFKIADGFEIKLFASERDGVTKPIQSRVDRLGRLWVIVSTAYPQLVPGEEPNDKVLVLEDTDHDGHVDKVTTFADGLMIPTGIELDGDARGCWVGEGTKLWHFRDDDGDGKADRKEVVMRGFGTGDNHQNINSFRWSPGGELFFSQGLHAFTRVETPWGVTKLDEAGYLRLRPRRQQLDAFWGGPADPQNPWGFAWDDWGALFVQAGNNGGLFDALPSQFIGGVAKRPASIWAEARGRKCSNPELVGTAHFPPEWQGVLLTGGYINHAVWALRLTPDGSSWKAADLPPLLTSTHESFRPVDVKFGPDGALYITDWYNPIIGHYQASFRHPDRDKSHGRIWRVTAKGRPLVVPPAVLEKGTTASVEELFSTLESPERFVRQTAKRILAAMPAEKVVPALRLGAASERVLFEILGVAEDHEAIEPELLQRALTASEPRLRAYAVGVLVRWWERLPVESRKLTPLARDADIRVRLAVVVAAANLPSVESVAVVLTASELPTDAPLDYAIRQAIARLRPQWEPALSHAESLGWKPEWVAFLKAPDAPAKLAQKADAKVAALVGDAMRAQPVAHVAPEFIGMIAKEVRERGDAKRGRAVFHRAELACLACHRVGEEGGSIGPDLNNIGSAQPLDFIIGAVLEPQREVKEGYEAIMATMKDSTASTGFRRPGEPQELVLFDAAQQREVRLQRAQIVSEKVIGSLMPAALVDKLSHEDLSDLFRYLSELGKQPASRSMQGNASGREGESH